MFKIKRVWLLVFVLLFICSCGTMNFGNTPWTLDIQNWSSHQKANFFMKTWMVEKNTYDSINAMENKPEELVDVLKSKRKVLENSRIPIRLYADIVAGGGTPSQESEQAIINWLRELQTQMIYKGG